MRQRRRTRARGIQGDGFAMETTLNQAGSSAVDLLEESTIRFLLDGLKVGSLGELKELVDAARSAAAEKRFMEERAGIYSTAIGLARLALRDDDSTKARQRLAEACDEVHRLHWDALLAAGHEAEKIAMFLGPRDETTSTEVRGDRYYNGFVAGLAAYAWWKDGTQYVGTTGKTLERALEQARETWNYSG
jgi:1,2-phenylacetyl-CoA epoxidase catalytic subunit